MKRFITLIIALAMVFIMSVPVFADDTAADESTPAQLTAAQVKAIKPAAKAASYSYTKIKVSWDKIEGVDGYKVYRATSKNGKYSLVKTVADPGTASYINTGRTTGKTYYYKVRAYKVIDGKTVYSKYSAVTSAYARPNKAKINKVYLPRDEQVKVTWNKVSGATGYQVYRKRVDKSTWKLFRSVSSKYTSVTDSLLGNATKPWGPNGNTLYDYEDLNYTWEYKVRAYRTVNGKKVYGLFSAPVAYECPWTKEELFEELWQYGESLEFPLYEFINADGSPNADGEYLQPKTDGSTYHFKCTVGYNADDEGEPVETVYANSENGNTEKGTNFVADTEKNCNWGVLWPVLVHPYRTKASILKEAKGKMEYDLGSIAWSNPNYWEPSGGFDDNDNWDDTGGWNGCNFFGVYFRPYLNGYKLYMLW